jgi:hypothetical protein
VARLKMERDILKNIAKGRPLLERQKLSSGSYTEYRSKAVGFWVRYPVKKRGPGTDADPAEVAAEIQTFG